MYRKIKSLFLVVTRWAYMGYSVCAFLWVYMCIDLRPNYIMSVSERQAKQMKPTSLKVKNDSPIIVLWLYAFIMCRCFAFHSVLFVLFNFACFVCRLTNEPADMSTRLYDHLVF